MPERQARSPNDRAMTARSALAGLGVLIPGMAGLGEALWIPAALVVAASVAAVAATPFFRAALEARPQRRWLTAEERAGVFLLWGFMLAGLARLSFPAALCVGGALAQLLTGGGALAGVGAGAALLVAGADPRVLALTAAGGATAQLCAGLSRPARSACARMNMAIASSFTYAISVSKMTFGSALPPAVCSGPSAYAAGLRHRAAESINAIS